MSESQSCRLSPGVKLALELGPLAIYLAITFKLHEMVGINLGEPVFIPAVIWLIIASPFQVGILWWGERRVPWSPLITAVFLIGFGLVSILLEDDRWIKAKPSVVYAFFAGALMTGYVLRKPLLKMVLGSQIEATDQQWNNLSLKFTIFFVALAILNEVVWRGFDLMMGAGTDASFQAWSASKLVFMVVSMVFTVAILFPLLQASTKTSKSSAED